MSKIQQESGQNTVPFLFCGERLALDLVNTELIKRRKRQDLLMTPQDVALWWQAACEQYLQRDKVHGENGDTITFDEELCNALKILRAALRAIFDALVAESVPEKKDIRVLNDVLRMGYPALNLTDQGGLHTSYYTTEGSKGLLLLPIALSALHIIHQDERKRLHRCDNQWCILFFYDTTRSATRRWCSLECLDRARSAQRYQQVKQQKVARANKTASPQIS